MKKFLIADDHFIVRTGISMLIRDEFINVEIEECADGYTVWKKIEAGPYDLAILDILMPGLDSISLLKNIFSHRPDQKVLILSISPEEIYAKKYLQLGVKGFINKDAEAPELRRAITSIMNNKRYLSPRMQDILTREVLEDKKASPFESLSTRELEVLNHMLEGKNTSQIAKLLSVHPSTAGTHKARILQKLGVSNVIELTRVARLFNTEYGLEMKA
jgi:DNA-binding NarL/FixJ family response regulator